MIVQLANFISISIFLFGFILEATEKNDPNKNNTVLLRANIDLSRLTCQERIDYVSQSYLKYLKESEVYKNVFAAVTDANQFKGMIESLKLTLSNGNLTQITKVCNYPNKKTMAFLSPLDPYETWKGVDHTDWFKMSLVPRDLLADDLQTQAFNLQMDLKKICREAVNDFTSITLATTKVSHMKKWTQKLDEILQTLTDIQNKNMTRRDKTIEKINSKLMDHLSTQMKDKTSITCQNKVKDQKEGFNALTRKIFEISDPNQQIIDQPRSPAINEPFNSQS